MLAIARRAVARADAIPGGWSLREDRLPDVHWMNSVVLDRCPPDGAALVTLAERWQAGLPQRRVAIRDAAAAERLAGELQPLGWERERVTLMARPPAEVAVATGDADPRGVELDEPAMRELEPRLNRDDAGRDASTGSPGVVDRLAAAQAAARAGTECRRLAAGEPGEPLSAMATLFCDPDVHGTRVAFLDSVVTLRSRRGRGLGDAVLGAAVAAARAWGADQFALAADADDWPQLWYARLGLRPVAAEVAWLLPSRRVGEPV